MKAVLPYFTFFIIILLLASCQPEPDDTILGPDPTGANDSTYLKLIVSFDTSFAAGIDTSEKYVFQYDGQKRVQLIDIYDYDPGTPGVAYHNFEKRFYAGNDTLPYKVIYYYDDNPSPALIDTVFLTYQNGVIVRDSALGGGSLSPQVNVTKYFQLSNNKFVAYIYSKNGSSFDLLDSVHSFQTRQNGNLVSQLDTAFESSTNTRAITREYDNHPSPFQRMSLPFPIVSDVANVGDYSYLQFAKSINNETRVQTIIDGMFNTDEVGIFQYRPDGYPIALRDGSPGGGHTFKSIIVYQKL